MLNRLIDNGRRRPTAAEQPLSALERVQLAAANHWPFWHSRGRADEQTDELYQALARTLADRDAPLPEALCAVSMLLGALSKMVDVRTRNRLAETAEQPRPAQAAE